MNGDIKIILSLDPFLALKKVLQRPNLKKQHQSVPLYSEEGKKKGTQPSGRLSIIMHDYWLLKGGGLVG